MKVSLTISRMIDGNGMSEILLCAVKKENGKAVRMRAHSETFILPVYFSETIGVDLTKKRVVRPDIRNWHIEAGKKLNGILSAIAEAEPKDKSENFATPDWLRNVVDRYLHPEKYAAQTEKPKTFYDLTEEYLRVKQFSPSYTNCFHVLVRAVCRYEGFTRATNKKQADFTFDINAVSRETIEDFVDYLRCEKELSGRYPKIFAKLLASYPANVKSGRNVIMSRGENAVIKLTDMLKAFFHWLRDTGRTENRPFEGVKVGNEKYGTPYYITIDERNKIASTPMPTKHLETQRDIFIFQCFVGCRVSDLTKLTADNIQGNMLTYAPHKTKDEGKQSRLATIPLHEKAVALIEKYKGADSQGRLFPFISDQKYNDAIKEVFKQADITRCVPVRNALTGENEQRPINEVASSHLARRTFVGNAYRLVQDPNIIGKMSGHVEGSKAFARYRNIENDTLRSVIDKIG